LEFQSYKDKVAKRLELLKPVGLMLPQGLTLSIG
jgi:invasion protein IalB